MVFDFPLYFAIRKVFAANGSPEQLPRVFAHDSAYTDPARLVTFLGLHDVSRFLFEAKDDDSALERAFTFLFAVRGTPMVYYGDEIGMTGGDDPENRRDFPGGWPGDSHDAFDAVSRTPRETRLFDRVKKLTTLRASSSALRQGTQVSVYASRSAYAFVRVASSGPRALVVVQNSPESQDLDIDLAAVKFQDGVFLRDVLDGAPSLTVHDGRVSVHSAEKTVRIYITN
jgi:glycosidase